MYDFDWYDGKDLKVPNKEFCLNKEDFEKSKRNYASALGFRRERFTEDLDKEFDLLIFPKRIRRLLYKTATYNTSSSEEVYNKMKDLVAFTSKLLDVYED